MTNVTQDPVEVGRAALARYAWLEAYEALTQPEAAGLLTSRDLEGLGEAAWWCGHLDRSISAREDAYRRYVDEGNPARAGIVAMALAKDYFAKGTETLGRAWFGRATRLLQDQRDTVEHAYLVRMQAVMNYEGDHDYQAAFELASEALEAATRHQDRDLMAMSLLDKGRSLISLGRVEEGMSLLEEAAIGAVGGDLGPYATSVVFCNTISVCQHIADYGRAGDWSEAAKRWCHRQDIAGFPGMCRVYRAEIMRLRGDWVDAEVEARKACEELRDFSVSYAAGAFYEVGEVRLRVGDLAAAEDAFASAHELGRDPQPGLAMVWLERGDTAAAMTSLQRSLAEDLTDLDRARLLPAQVEVALAAGESEVARQAAEELRRIADTFSTAALEARALDAGGQTAIAAGDAEAAVRHLRLARALWQKVDAPYEMARTRVLLGQAHRMLGHEEEAMLELKAACGTFDKLGAVPDQQRVIKQLGARGIGGSRGTAASVIRTFMFTDIVNSTPLVEAIGDEAWTDLVRWHDEVLRSSFADHHGREVDHAGDGFFVAFDSVNAAVECAVQIQRALRNHRREHGFAPKVRIGLHRADATESGSSYRGKGVHAAARIAATAEGGQIIGSAETLTNGAQRFPLSAPSSLSLKGIEDPVEVVEVDWS